MNRFRSVRLALGALALLLAGAVPAVARAEAPGAEQQTRTPIKHVITLMQENHSFDNYFGTYPGAEGLPPNTCIAVDIFVGPNSQCVKPFHLGDQAIFDLSHDVDTAHNQYNDGKMDAFIHALRLKGQDGSLAMGYYNGQDIPYYWNLADNYVLFDRMFSSALDGSFDNHVYWVAGARLGKTTFTSQAASDMTTIFDRLEEKGISWKFYVENYDSTVNYRTQSAIEIENPNRISQIIWVPLLNMDHYLDDPKLFSRIVDLSEYYTDVQNGTLPAVSYIVPSGASEHPPGRIQSGERFTRGLVQELMRSSSWSTSAFLISYDDWGGWYDHVPPPQVDDFGYGFRVPTLLVSPYAKQGFIDHTEYDFTSIMKFIEENWGLAPLAERDANARNILNAFDFNQPPRPPNFVSSARGVAPPASPSLPIIYVAYGAILFLAGVFLVRAVITRQRPQPIRARQRRVP